MSKVIPPSEFRVGTRQRLVKSEDIAYDGDPRGIVWLYEPPNPRAKYVIGVDATQGRTGWNRYSRTENDSDIDNGAVEVIRIGRGEPGAPNFSPDVQVAEYAAPVDPMDLAAVVNTLGRMYCGREEDGQAYVIVEAYPGPGGPCQMTLQEKYGYTNLYRTQYMDTGRTPERNQTFGWYSNRQSMQYLWTKGLRFLHRKQLILKSSYLVEELARCNMDLIRMRGAAAGGGHDDRVTAMLLAIWGGHNWTHSIEPDTVSKVQVGPAVDYQCSDVSSDRMQELYDEKWDEISREAESDYA